MIIEFDGQKIEMNEEFSFKDFTGQVVTGKLSGNIYASCFSQEIPDSIVFPEGMKGVKFYNCNLDNCFIPEGNEIIGLQPRRFKVQNDLRDWEVDKNDKPVKVLNEKYWRMNGFSVDKADIPEEKLVHISEVKKASEVADGALGK